MPLKMGSSFMMLTVAVCFLRLKESSTLFSPDSPLVVDERLKPNRAGASLVSIPGLVADRWSY